MKLQNNQIIQTINSFGSFTKLKKVRLGQVRPIFMQNKMLILVKLFSPYVHFYILQTIKEHAVILSRQKMRRDQQEVKTRFIARETQATKCERSGSAQQGLTVQMILPQPPCSNTGDSSHAAIYIHYDKALRARIAMSQ